MNDNTILRIKVPAHLYESVKEQLSLKEGKQNFGTKDMKAVKVKEASSGDKPKKTSAPKAPKAKQAKAPETKDDAPHDGMNKMKKKERTLDELKAAHKALTDKIKELEEYHEPENIYDDEVEDDSKKKVKQAVKEAEKNTLKEEEYDTIRDLKSALGKYPTEEDVANYLGLAIDYDKDSEAEIKRKQSSIDYYMNLLGGGYKPSYGRGYSRRRY